MKIPPTDPAAQFLTIRQASKASGAPENLLRDAVRQGRLPQYLGDTGWPRVNLGEVVELVRATRRVAVEPCP